MNTPAPPVAPTEEEREARKDDAAVDALAVAMKGKLAVSRAKGRGRWQDMQATDLSRMLREHVDKGDPRDVANFCMFLWSLNAPITATDDSAISLHEQLAEKDAEIGRLESLVYAPGLRRCPKCKFVLLSQTLHMENGAVTANDRPDVCPNGCGPLWRVTERDNRIEMQNHAEEVALQNPSQATVIDTLHGALCRLQVMSLLVLAGKSVRDADEVLSQVKSALAVYEAAKAKGETK